MWIRWTSTPDHPARMPKTPLTILTHPNPLLRIRAAAVDAATLERLTREGFIAALMETMRIADGVGIAAAQVGAAHRIIVVAEADGPHVYVNPEITSRSIRTGVGLEGCLSVPGVVGSVRRAKAITLRAHDASFRPVTKRCRDLVARIVQHEVDHLDGVLFIDRAIRTMATPKRTTAELRV